MSVYVSYVVVVVVFSTVASLPANDELTLTRYVSYGQKSQMFNLRELDFTCIEYLHHCPPIPQSDQR